MPLSRGCPGRFFVCWLVGFLLLLLQNQFNCVLSTLEAFGQAVKCAPCHNTEPGTAGIKYTFVSPLNTNMLAAPHVLH